MSTPSKKVLSGRTDPEDAIGATDAPVNWKARGYAGQGVDTVRTTRAPNASQGSIPTPKVSDDGSVPVTGTKFGPNSRGFPNTLAHNDDWHDKEFGG